MQVGSMRLMSDEKPVSITSNGPVEVGPKKEPPRWVEEFRKYWARTFLDSYDEHNPNHVQKRNAYLAGYSRAEALYLTWNVRNSPD